MNLIFDSHAHYDDNAFDNDRHEVISSMPEKNVCAILNAASNIKSARQCIKLAEKYPFVWAAVGVHPHDASRVAINYLSEIEAMLENKKVVAIGEIGLDYHYDFSPRDIQKKTFEDQLILANKHGLPVIVHDREAHEDTLELLKKHKPKGVVHCFSGSTEMALEIIKMGMYIGLGGAVTFKNAKKPIEVLENIPISRILIETDAPYMTPVPYRGKRCDSSLIPYSAQKIADIKNIPINALLIATRDNATKLFNIDLK